MKHASLAQLFIMAAIVATLSLPPAAGLAWLACSVLGFSFEALVTFGDRLSAPVGVSAWWAIVFLPAFAYAAFMLKE